MFNNFNTTYQPYIFMQLPNNSFPPLLFKENSSFLIPSFIPIQYSPNGIELPNLASSNTINVNSMIFNSNQQSETNGSKKSSQAFQNKHIIKEKLIKKPVKRPSIYLTEKQYYLGLTLENQQNSDRKLRPRNLKKKQHRHQQKMVQKDENVILLENKDQNKEVNAQYEPLQSSQKRNIFGFQKNQQKQTIFTSKSMKNIETQLNDMQIK